MPKALLYVLFLSGAAHADPPAGRPQGFHAALNISHQCRWCQKLGLPAIIIINKASFIPERANQDQVIRGSVLIQVSSGITPIWLGLMVNAEGGNEGEGSQKPDEVG